jgi:hypothetical protein
VNATLVIDYADASLGVVVWLVLTWALMRGRDWARIALAADFAWIILMMLVAIVQRGAVYAPADLITGAVWSGSSPCPHACSCSPGRPAASTTPNPAP